MKTILALALLAGLTGCATSPPLNEAAVQQIQASTPASEGVIKYSTVGIWIPNSKEFSFTELAAVKGVVVVTDKGVLFEQWGGDTGLNIVKRIPFASIKTESLITFGASARVVIVTDNGQYHSFAASDGPGDVSVRAGTEEIRRAIQKYMKHK